MTIVHYGCMAGSACWRSGCAEARPGQSDVEVGGWESGIIRQHWRWRALKSPPMRACTWSLVEAPLQYSRPSNRNIHL